MKHLKRFNENVTSPFDIDCFYDMDIWIEKNHPTLLQYKDDNAQLDDVVYSIPYDVFNKVTGLDKDDIEKISSNFTELGEGITCYNDLVEISVGV
jgi:hypothetical protein